MTNEELLGYLENLEITDINTIISIQILKLMMEMSKKIDAMTQNHLVLAEIVEELEDHIEKYGESMQFE